MRIAFFIFKNFFRASPFTYLFRKYCVKASRVICDTLLPVRFFSAISLRSNWYGNRMRMDSPCGLFFFIGGVHLYRKNWFVISFCQKCNTFSVLPGRCCELNIRVSRFISDIQKLFRYTHQPSPKIPVIIYYFLHISRSLIYTGIIPCP
jgi:hypothetical protein